MSRKISGYSLIRPARLDPVEFKALISGKGWRMADVACRWGIKPETLSRLAANPDRDFKWDDLARALPHISRSERAAATEVRLALNPPKKRLRIRNEPKPHAAKQQDPALEVCDELEERYGTTKQHQNGLRYQGYLVIGDELIATEDIDSFASAGDHLYVLATELGTYLDGSIREDYLIESEHGDARLFTPEDMDRWMAATGRSRSTG